MTTPTLTLTDFLLARLDEADAREWADAAGDAGMPVHVYRETTAGAFRAVSMAARRVPACMPLVQRAMAAKYADHPDYREEWRP